MTDFTTLILTSADAWHWFGIGIILIIMDVLTGASFFILWIGISALTVAIVLAFLPSMKFEYQLLVFSVQSFASILFWRFYLRHNPTISDQPQLNRRAEQYIGRVFTLEQPIINGRGQVHVEDSIWRVSGPDLPAGSKVKVVAANGVILEIISYDQTAK